MPEFLILILLASVVLALWAFSRARQLHNRIEDMHPGFNEWMHRCWKRQR